MKGEESDEGGGVRESVREREKRERLEKYSGSGGP